MSTLEDFEFFQTLARCETLSAAAQELSISAAAASKRLSRIENDLGIQLVTRNTRSMTLTSEGMLFLQEARFISHHLDAFYERLQAANDDIEGSLRINASLGFGRKYIADAVSQFAQTYPNISVETELSDHPLDLVTHGYDLGIRFGALSNSSLRARRLAPHRRLLAVAPAYLHKHGVPATPDALAYHQCIVIKQNDAPFGVWQLAGRHGDVQRIRVRGRLASNDGESAVIWALAGHGIIQRASWELAPYLRSGELIEILSSYALPQADITATYPHQRTPPRKVSAFLDFLTSYLNTEIC